MSSRHKKSRSKIRESNRRQSVSVDVKPPPVPPLPIWYRPRGGGGSAAPKVGKSSEEGVRVGVRCAANVVPVQNVQSSECPGDGAEC